MLFCWLLKWASSVEIFYTKSTLYLKVMFIKAQYALKFADLLSSEAFQIIVEICSSALRYCL